MMQAKFNLLYIFYVIRWAIMCENVFVILDCKQQRSTTSRIVMEIAHLSLLVVNIFVI